MLENKIKIFRFEVSNVASGACAEDVNQPWYSKNIEKLATNEEIEDKINTFIKDKCLIEIKINNIDIDYHNNGRGNHIELLYTVIYRALK
jgi:predicted CoA-binding protein